MAAAGSREMDGAVMASLSTTLAASFGSCGPCQGMDASPAEEPDHIADQAKQQSADEYPPNDR